MPAARPMAAEGEGEMADRLQKEAEDEDDAQRRLYRELLAVLETT